MTLFVPCVANLLMIIRERALRTGLAILAAVTVIAIGTARPCTSGSADEVRIYNRVLSQAKIQADMNTPIH